jgi:hypothetical protein
VLAYYLLGPRHDAVYQLLAAGHIVYQAGAHAAGSNAGIHLAIDHYLG